MPMAGTGTKIREAVIPAPTQQIHIHNLQGSECEEGSHIHLGPLWDIGEPFFISPKWPFGSALHREERERSPHGQPLLGKGKQHSLPRMHPWPDIPHLWPQPIFTMTLETEIILTILQVRKLSSERSHDLPKVTLPGKGEFKIRSGLGQPGFLPQTKDTS